MEDYFDIIFKTAQMSVYIPLAIAVFRFRYLDRIKWILLVLLVISVGVAVIARYLWTLQENNLHLLHFYTVAEFCGWSMIYYFLYDTILMKRLILFLGIGFVIFAILNSLFLQDLTTFNSNSRSLESILLVLLSIGYYFKIFKEKKIIYLERSDRFWLNAASLIYFSGSFLLFGFSNLLLQSNSYEIKEIWVIHGVFLIVHYSLITIGLWIKSDQIVSL